MPGEGRYTNATVFIQFVWSVELVATSNRRTLTKWTLRSGRQCAVAVEHYMSGFLLLFFSPSLSLSPHKAFTVTYIQLSRIGVVVVVDASICTHYKWCCGV